LLLVCSLKLPLLQHTALAVLDILGFFRFMGTSMTSTEANAHHQLSMVSAVIATQC
jgi:hypothetical protein